MSHDKVIRKSHDILKSFMQAIDIRAYKNILLYACFNNEVETNTLISEIIKQGGNVFLPVLISDTQFVACGFSHVLIKNKYGINEPKKKNIEKNIDLVVCPGVAFDKNLNRIGFGGGYYDRYLSDHKKALKVGLAFDFQIVKNIYPDETDIKMDIIITEKRCIK